MRRALQRIGWLVFWLAWPVLRVYLGLRDRTRIILWCGGNVVALKGWLSNNKWGLPGGGLHKGEQPLAGLIRELREETGISLRPAAVTPLASQMYKSRGFRFRCHYYFARLQHEETLTPQWLEISELRWIKASELNTRNANADVLAGLALARDKALLQ